MPGGKEFLDELRSLVQVVILSDTFEQFAAPLLRQLGWPTLLCHRLVVENDRIVNYQLRIREQKREAVAAFKRMNYHVISAGDSFNDTAMLLEANVGFLFHAPDNVKQTIPAVQGRRCLSGSDEAHQRRDGLTLEFKFQLAALVTGRLQNRLKLELQLFRRHRQKSSCRAAQCG